ncbi:MAG: hypothetical protein M0C28_31775, partial [Candidatus Moduliflexus flocculans]|nr:hypothetical protein [Candidatus Moduliflexus flocculans]
MKFSHQRAPMRRRPGTAAASTENQGGCCPMMNARRGRGIVAAGVVSLFLMIGAGCGSSSRSKAPSDAPAAAPVPAPAP